MEGSVITDEMRAMIGKPLGEPYTAGEAYLGNIRKFAKAVGDNNPLWSDEEYAKGTRWGGVISPPTFVDSFSAFYVLADDDSQGYLGGHMPVERPFKHGFSAGDEYELFKPVRPGDVITVTTAVGDIYEKQGRPGIGRMLFIRYDKTYRNQRDEVVAVCRWTSVNYEGMTEQQA